MKERLFIFLALIVLIIILIGLNAASFVQKEKTPDSEIYPNRSTYNTGATGTRAFYDLLSETGRKVTRWQEPPSALRTAGKNAPATFVVIGMVRREFADDEIKHLLEWVRDGGNLVVIDREPPAELISTTANWRIEPIRFEDTLRFSTDPSNQNQMTDKIVAGKPVQPTVYTVNINAVQSSRFASSVDFAHFEEDSAKKTGLGTTEKTTSSNKRDSVPTDGDAPVTTIQTDSNQQPAPVIHIANDSKNLLVDIPFGAGRIVYLTDPYIVSNGGISLVDNARLGINIVASSDGLIAFDEYHQGFGNNRNALFTYFAGTPVIPIILQLAVLVGAIFYSQSRRFARPLPDDEPNRLSKLEYVAAMAELQQRARSFDLAIENIYNDFRRRVARAFGIDNHATTRKEMAGMIAERTKLDRNDVEDVMFKCEDIMYGEPTGKKEMISITRRLREIEEKLGLQRRKRRKSVS